MIVDWIKSKPDLAEIHSSASTFGSIILPNLTRVVCSGILGKDVEVLAKSKAYPYGLTDDKIARLKSAGINTVQELADATDGRLLRIDMVGPATVKRMRDVMRQAIWM